MKLLTQSFPGINFASRVQNYDNVIEHGDAAKKGADIVEVKYDGWWGRLHVENQIGRVYSRQGQLKHEAKIDIPDCVLIGEFLKGTQRVVQGGEGAANDLKVFDCLEWDGGLVAHLPLLRRKRTVNALARYTDSWVSPVDSFDIAEADVLWQKHVIEGNAEGLCYKRMSDSYVGSTIWRKKKEVTMDYVVMGVVEGAGKHKGRLGAVVAGLYVNGSLIEKVRVGGGFNDVERQEIFDNPAKYTGRVLEVRGWQLFDSGAVRHPNAVRGPDGKLLWREDKLPTDCTWK